MKIVFIGAGNVATHLSKALKGAGVEVVQVFSRNLLKARDLSKDLAATFTDDLDEITVEADLYVLAVHDDAIGEVAARLAQNGLGNKLIVHTSGATPRKILENASQSLKRVGVFYPLQTFSKTRQPDFSQIPICVDANETADLTRLTTLASKLSSHVYHIDDDKRATLHLAAVFVNNFTNHLFAIGEKILATQGLPLAMLLPLIRETVAKLDDGPPGEMQTGPAIRHDQVTVDRHLEQLKGQPEVQEIYRLFTSHIQAAQ